MIQCVAEESLEDCMKVCINPLYAEFLFENYIFIKICFHCSGTYITHADDVWITMENLFLLNLIIF